MTKKMMLWGAIGVVGLIVVGFGAAAITHNMNIERHTIRTVPAFVADFDVIRRVIQVTDGKVSNSPQCRDSLVMKLVMDSINTQQWIKYDDEFQRVEVNDLLGMSQGVKRIEVNGLKNVSEMRENVEDSSAVRGITIPLSCQVVVTASSESGPYIYGFYIKPTTDGKELENVVFEVRGSYASFRHLIAWSRDWGTQSRLSSSGGYATVHNRKDDATGHNILDGKE